MAVVPWALPTFRLAGYLPGPDADRRRTDAAAEPPPSSWARASTFAGRPGRTHRICRLPHGPQMRVCRMTWSGRLLRLGLMSEVDRTARQASQRCVSLERECELWGLARKEPDCRSPIWAYRQLRPHSACQQAFPLRSAGEPDFRPRSAGQPAVHPHPACQQAFPPRSGCLRWHRTA
jgi:hypothetical protein